MEPFNVPHIPRDDDMPRVFTDEHGTWIYDPFDGKVYPVNK